MQNSIFLVNCQTLHKCKTFDNVAFLAMLALPDIVICPLNRFNRSYLDHLNVTEGLAQYLEMSYTFWPLYKFQEEVYNRTLIDLDAYQSDLELLLDKLGGNMSYAQFLDKVIIYSCVVNFLISQSIVCLT